MRDVQSATDTILGQCMARAAINLAGDSAGFMAVIRTSATAARVAAFITLWAYALQDTGQDEIGIEEFSRWSAESRATVYRRQQAFRELWPEFETPNEIAAAVLDVVRRTTVDLSPHVRVPVFAAVLA